MALRYRDVELTEQDETFTVACDTVTWGRGGADSLLGVTGQNQLMIGGAGNDTYSVTRNNYITVLDGGGGSDTLAIADFSMSAPNCYWGTLEGGQHLFFIDWSSNARAVVVLDWKTEASRIETVITADGMITYDQLLSLSQTTTPIATFSSTGFIVTGAANGMPFLGDATFETAMLVPQGTTGAEAREAYSHYAGLATTTPAGGTGTGGGAGSGSGAVSDGRIILNGQSVAASASGRADLGLAWELTATTAGDVISCTRDNDFVNGAAGDDAIDGGAGNDILDGGLGSNFLTGGAGADRFFVDGRAASGATGSAVWSTVTDFGAGTEQVTVWGWTSGVSRYSTQDSAGTAGYQGATVHFDLNGDGVTDASLTLTGQPATFAITAGSVAGAEYMLIG